MTTEQNAEAAPLDVIAGYACTLSYDELRLEIMEVLDRALALNDSGTFSIAAALMLELEVRGPAAPKLVTYRKKIEAAVTVAVTRVQMMARAIGARASSWALLTWETVFMASPAAKSVRHGLRPRLPTAA